MILRNVPFTVNGCNAIINACFASGSITEICVNITIKHPYMVDVNADGYDMMPKYDTINKPVKKAGKVIGYKDVKYRPSYSILWKVVNIHDLPAKSGKYALIKHIVNNFYPTFTMSNRLYTSEQYSEALSFLLTK